MTAPRRPHIALVVPGGIGTGAGNLGVPVLERQVKLLSKDFDLTVFSLFPVNEGYQPDNFEIISIASRNPIVKSFALWRHFKNNHRKKKFLAIHAFWVLPSGFLAVILGKLYGVKSVVSVLGGDAVAIPEINYGLLGRFLPRQLILWTLRNANHVMALTSFLADSLARHGLRRKLDIIPWGIDTESFRHQQKSFNQPIRFLHIGNLSYVKDQFTLLRAFQIIQSNIPVHLTIIGEGTLLEDISALILELKIGSVVDVIPPMPYDLLPAFYEKADVLLHTSLSEGQSEVVTEAMSAGLLVCGTKVGLMYDLPECCVSVPVRDHEALAREVLRILKSTEKINALVRRAGAWTQSHDIHWTVRKTKEMYLSE